MSGWRKVAFALFMIALTFLFIGLGVWQWQRLEEKEALVATVTDRLGDAPIPFPEPQQWTTVQVLGEGFYDYRPVTVTGRFLPDQTVFVFTSLTDPKGPFSGPGYWVMTPLLVDAESAVWINRGFIPEAERGNFADAPIGGVTVTLAGIAKPSETAGAFTPGPDVAQRIDWVRSIPRLNAFLGQPLQTAQVYVDLPAEAPGELPQGGETEVDFPNNHLGYALTWFGFALLTPILLFFWLRRQRSPKTP